MMRKLLLVIVACIAAVSGFTQKYNTDSALHVLKVKKDSTLNAPTSWLWSFGDNTTSTLQNPVHQYLTAGVFTVKLKVSNNIGIDSVEILNYFYITGLNGPRPASCIGTTSALSSNHGTKEYA